MTRRRSQAIAAVALTALLAGCSSSGPEPTGSADSGESEIPGPTSTSTTVATATSGPADASDADIQAGWHAFTASVPQGSSRPCDADDLFSEQSGASPLQGASFQLILVHNGSGTSCQLRDVGAKSADFDAEIAMRGLLPFKAAPLEVHPGEHAVFALTSSARIDSPSEQLILTIAGATTQHYIGYAYPGSSGLVGPIIWNEPVSTLRIFWPATPGVGEPVTSTDRLTIFGLGTIRPGLSLQELADATGQPVLTSVWYRDASSGCGYARLAGVAGVSLQIGGGDFDPADAIVRAVSIGPGWATYSGLSVGSTFAEIDAALGSDRLSTFEDVYDGADNVLFTPRDPAEAHLAMLFRGGADTADEVVGGLAAGIYRSEGCA